MTTLFHDMKHDIIKDYVDDLLAKSKTREIHLTILASIFDKIEQ